MRQTFRLKINNICFIKKYNLIFIFQIVLGILMTFQNIPWYLALAHQGNSIILFLISLSMWMLSKKSLQKNFNEETLS